MGKRSSVSKFPVARIKKIMQTNEDVGKVAQATPVVVCESDGAFPSLESAGQLSPRVCDSKGTGDVYAEHR